MLGYSLLEYTWVGVMPGGFKPPGLAHEVRAPDAAEALLRMAPCTPLWHQCLV